MKLTSKLAVLFVLLSIVPLSLVSYLSYENHWQTIEQETINRLVSTTILKEAAVKRWVEDAKQSIQELARRPLIQKYAAVLVSRGQADPEYRAAQRSIHDEHLNPTLEEERSLLELFILCGSDGLILVSSDEKQEGRYRESERYFVEGKDRIYVQNVYYSLPLGKAVMTIGTPVKDKDGNLIAVLAGHVDLAEMSEIMMRRSGLSATEKTYAVNKFNFFVTDPGLEPGSALKKAVYTDGVKAGLEHQNGVGFYNDYRGVPVIGAYRWMPERELVILAEVDQAEAFAPILALRKARLGIGVAVALVVALLGLFFARTITRPVLQLVRGAEEVGRGNLEYRIELRARDEIGQLAAAFNEMTADLRRSLGALRESETRYTTLFAGAAEGILVADLQTKKFSFANPAICRMFSYTEEEFVRLGVADIHPQESLQHALAEFAAQGRGEKTLAPNIPCLRKDGTIFYADIYTASISLDGRECNVGFFADITEHKRAEEALLESEEKYKTLFNSAGDAIFIMNHTIFLECNIQTEKIYGCTKDQIIGHSPVEYSPEKQPDGSFSEHAAVKKIEAAFAGEPQTFEWLHTRLDGTPFYAEVSLIRVHIGEGHVLQAIVRDITERRRAEEALLESKAKLRNIVEFSTNLFYSHDTNHVLQYLSPQVKDVLGYEVEEALIKWTALVSDNPINDVGFQKTMNAIETGIAQGPYELEFIHKSGKRVWGEVREAPVVEKGKTVAIVGSLTDITARKRAEEDLQAAYGQSIIHAQELKEQIEERERTEEEKKKVEAQLYQSQKMEAIGTLAGGVAHDFNNLLTVIIGNAQLALMNVIKDESLRKKIEEIEKAGDRAASLTRQLLAFSRKQIITPRVLDLNELLTGMEKMLGRLIGEDVELLTIPGHALWQVEADPGQVEQLIMNLAVNAKDAMPQGGKITIETANTDLDENYFRKHGIEGEKPGHYVMLAVSDNGCGMDKETLSCIFDPFFTTKEVGKGTGLGLSTVYGIVKQNNGIVRVYSEPGQGSTFKIYQPAIASAQARRAGLPRTEGDADSEEKQRLPVIELDGSETILIVEDNDGLRKFTQEVLLLHGYKVLDAENGEDALRVSQAHEGPIHLMITDVVMPKMGGKEAAERLQPFYPRMKVIYMSGYTDNAIVEHGVLAPGLNFLQKPFTSESLARKVREMLDAEKK